MVKPVIMNVGTLTEVEVTLQRHDSENACKCLATVLESPAEQLTARLHQHLQASL